MTGADNSHAERKIAKRRAIRAAVKAYDKLGGMRYDWRARVLATDQLAVELGVSMDNAAELLADALATRASFRVP